MRLLKLGAYLVNPENITFVTPIEAKNDPGKHEGVKIHFVGGSTLDFMDPNALAGLESWATNNGVPFNRV